MHAEQHNRCTTCSLQHLVWLCWQLGVEIVLQMFGHPRFQYFIVVFPCVSSVLVGYNLLNSMSVCQCTTHPPAPCALRSKADVSITSLLHQWCHPHHVTHHESLRNSLMNLCQVQLQTGEKFHPGNDSKGQMADSANCAC